MFSLLFLAGVIAGVVTVSQLTKNFSVSDVSDLLLVDSIKGNVAVFSYFLTRFLGYLFIMLVFALLTLNFFVGFFVGFFVFYRAYKIGLSVSIYIMLYGIGGVLNIVLIYLPFQLLLNFLLIIYASYCFKNAHDRHKLKCKACIRDYSFFVSFVVIFLILCLLESLLVPAILRNIVLSA